MKYLLSQLLESWGIDIWNTKPAPICFNCFVPFLSMRLHLKFILMHVDFLQGAPFKKVTHDFIKYTKFELKYEVCLMILSFQTVIINVNHPLTLATLLGNSASWPGNIKIPNSSKTVFYLNLVFGICFWICVNHGTGIQYFQWPNLILGPPLPHPKLIQFNDAQSVTLMT